MKITIKIFISLILQYSITRVFITYIVQLKVHANEGFLVYTSADMKNWKANKADDGYALRKGNVYGTANFWAPQVFFHNNRFYMAYVANENIAIAVFR